MPKGSGLSFEEAQEPAFLSKLKAQASGRNLDHHERQAPRPRRARVTDEEDGPTIVDEENRDFSKDDFETLKAGKELEYSNPPNDSDKVDRTTAQSPSDYSVGQQEGPNDKQKVADIGGFSKKRKAVKLGSSTEEEKTEPSNPKAMKKVKQKKGKAVTLSFTNEEESI